MSQNPSTRRPTPMMTARALNAVGAPMKATSPTRSITSATKIRRAPTACAAHFAARWGFTDIQRVDRLPRAVHERLLPWARLGEELVHRVLGSGVRRGAIHVLHLAVPAPA